MRPPGGVRRGGRGRRGRGAPRQGPVARRSENAAQPRARARKAVGRRRLPPPRPSGDVAAPPNGVVSTTTKGRLVAKLGNIHIWGTGKRGPALAPNIAVAPATTAQAVRGAQAVGTDQQVGSSGGSGTRRSSGTTPVPKAGASAAPGGSARHSRRISRVQLLH